MHNKFHIALGCLGGVILMNTVVGLVKTVGFAVMPSPPMSPDQASQFSSLVGLTAAGSFLGGYYLITKIVKKNLAFGLVTLTGIAAIGLVSYIAQAQAQNDDSRKLVTNITPTFTQLDFNEINTQDFSIRFPSNPRKAVVNQSTPDSSIQIETYQAGDGLGMYTFSYGRLDKALSDNLTKKQFISNLFRSLVSVAKDAKVITEQQSDQMPFDLTYLYTSNFNGISMSHMGMTFLANDKAYAKITIVCPTDQVEEGQERYSSFLKTLDLKNR